MAKLSFNIEGQTLGAVGFGFEVPDVDAGRILVAFGGIFGPVTESVPVADGFEIVERPRTPQEVAERIARNAINDLLLQTVEYERQQAVKVARDAISEIVPVPLEA